ncbi:MAG TPA: sigma 54-interacting transcriptional regulator [Thermoanaerobaculaceae bacterium]|nr:sigma 54-interacting transcriptional regulator [Thermoanaerobaculaceae bacterium]
MSVRAPGAAALARLLAWDAACLPDVADPGGERDAVSVRCNARGAELAAVARWPRGQRAAVAVQVITAAAFLFERGWYPSRGLLRGGRVERGASGPWYRLARLPRLRLDDAGLERHLRLALASEATLLVPAVLPLLRRLLPEMGDELEGAARVRPVWEVTAGWLGVLIGNGKRPGSALAHLAGSGRALWALRYEVPTGGVCWVEDEALLPQLAAAVRLAALGRNVAVAAGALDEADVTRAQAHAAASGRDAVVLTTLPLPGVAPVELAAGTESVWVVAPRPDLAHAHAVAAREGRPGVARLVAEAGAANGFARPPRLLEALRARAGLASGPARAALGWLASAPVGLSAEELGALAAEATLGLAELKRLGLAYERRGVWRAPSASAAPAPERLTAMAQRLPATSPAGLVARAVAGEWEPAAAWCEERLERGAFAEAWAVASAATAAAPPRLVAAEAALGLGRLAEAEASLEAVPAAERETRWHALAAWWAEEASASERAGVELVAATGELPGRLSARCELVAAQAARRRGDRPAQRRHLERAAACTVPPLPEVEIELAAWQGASGLRALAHRREPRWRGDGAARLLHVTSSAALDRGCRPAAMTGLRAALRVASGENPHLLGEIHADLACAAILAEQPGVADRHLVLAEGLLERCGSRRAATVVRANRAVLADDRLDWRRSRELTLAGRRLRGEVDDAGTWLFELELARADLARGDTAAVRDQLARLAGGVAQFPDDPFLQQAFAGLAAHLALALGDLAGAVSSASAAEAGERGLVLAVAAADLGNEPPAALARRWGMAVTAQLLAAWRREDETGALASLERALEHWPREAGVGLARFTALLARRGERLGAAWDDVVQRAEEVLGQADLDGWARVLRGACGPDPARVVRALDGIVNAGTDACHPARLEALARALDLGFLEVERGGAVLGRWGEPQGPRFTVEAGGAAVRAGGVRRPLADAALGMVARCAGGAAGSLAAVSGRATGALLGESRALAVVREEVARWGPLPLTVLIVGEPGTGKELVARELHRSSGRRGAFVPVNCAGIPSALLEAELFGVTRGAFTGADRDREGLVEAAEGGTLFLDEVGELPLELQGKLLRLLQEREVRRVGATRARTVDVRFVAATNRDLKGAAAAGAFRQDLYYRLAVAVIEVPPLRVRPADIAELACHFAGRFAAMLGRPGVRLAPAAVELLCGASWPGNVRELESAVARAVAAGRPGEVLGPDRFPGLTPAPAGDGPLPGWPAALASFRRTYFTAILRESAGNRTRAARRAGISRQTLLYHLKGLGIRGGESG